MTGAEQIYIEPYFAATEQIGGEGIDKVMYFIGDRPLKMAALLGLRTFPIGYYVTRSELANRLDYLQGPEPGWKFKDTSNVLFSACRTSLQPAGLVEFGSKLGSHGPAEAVRLKAMGLTIGTTVAGALFVPELHGDEDPYMQDIMGDSQQQYVKGGGVLTNVVLYKELLRRPSNAASVAELREKCGSKAAIFRRIRELSLLGVLQFESNYDPADRKFAIGDLSDVTLTNMGPELRATIAAVATARKNGAEQVTGADILDGALELFPHLSREKIWEALLSWLRRPSRAQSLLVEQAFPQEDGRRRHTQVRLDERHRVYLMKLFGIHDLLRAATPEGELFRKTAKERAETEIVTSKSVMAALLKKARSGARGTKSEGVVEWTGGLERYVPNEGISTVDLHRIVAGDLGNKITYQNFRARLANMSNFIILEGVIAPQGGGMASSRVLPRVQRFPGDWVHDAGCSGQDPELFYPVGTKGPAVVQAEQAKRICQACPVRLACLKEALTKKDRAYGIQGGVWLERIHSEMTPKEIEYIRRNVQISPRPLRSIRFAGGRVDTEVSRESFRAS